MCVCVCVCVPKVYRRIYIDRYDEESNAVMTSNCCVCVLHLPKAERLST